MTLEFHISNTSMDQGIHIVRVPKGAGSRLAKSQKLQSSRDPGLQDSKVAEFQGYKAPGI